MVAIKPHCNVNGAVDHFVCTMTNEFCIFIIMSKCHCPSVPPVRCALRCPQCDGIYSGALMQYICGFHIFCFRDIAYENNLYPGMEIKL